MSKYPARFNGRLIVLFQSREQVNRYLGPPPRRLRQIYVPCSAARCWKRLLGRIEESSQVRPVGTPRPTCLKRRE